MSLLKQYSSVYVLMEKVENADGVGGRRVEWHEGRRIELALAFENSSQIRRADKDDTATTFRFCARKDCALKFNDVLKRVSDGEIFRVTSNADELFTPNSSALNLTTFNAERWQLT